MKRMMRYFRQFYAQCGKAVLLYLLLTIIHKILAFISPPAVQWLIDAVIAGDGNGFLRMLVVNVLITLAFNPPPPAPLLAAPYAVMPPVA